MSRTERSSAVATHHSPRIRWQFESDVPTLDFFDGLDLANDWDIQEAIDSFVSEMQDHRFHAWEGVICEEQGIPPTPQQREAAEELHCFGSSADEDTTAASRVLYINEIPRSTEPWYELMRTIAARLLLDPYDVTANRCDVYCHGWSELEERVVEHGAGLSLPEGAGSPLDVIPAELRYRLRLQDCFFSLPGSGYANLSLDDQDTPIHWFIDDLRDSREAVEYFDLTLDSLLTLVKLPEDERPHFSRLMIQALELESTTDRLAQHLFAGCVAPASRLPAESARDETSGADGLQSCSTAVLPAESIKQAILHPDLCIREMAVRYFADSFVADGSIMSLVIEALERHGKDGAYMLVGAAVNLPQTDETIGWLIRELNDERSTTYESYTYNLERVLCAADPRLLGPREDDIALAEHLTQGAYDIITERVQMLSWDVDRCWRELYEHCEQYRDAVSSGEANLDRAGRIVEALAHHDGCDEQVLDLLARRFDPHIDTSMEWMEPMIVRLAGWLRLEDAIPRLIDKMRLDNDLLPHECQVALTRIGSDAVVRAVVDAFVGGPWHFRLVATTVLENVHIDLAVRSTLELLPHETDAAVGRRLRQALLGHFTCAGVEPARQWLLERGVSDFEDRGLRNDLLRTCAVIGQNFPEYEEWKHAQDAAERRRLSVLEETKENPLAALLYAMEQLTGKKTEDVIKEIEERDTARRRERIPDQVAPARQPIALPRSRLPTSRAGRNDPCPCGSGKKYKKCCLRK